MPISLDDDFLRLLVREGVLQPTEKFPFDINDPAPLLRELAKCFNPSNLPPVTITNLAGNCVCSHEETKELLCTKGGYETLSGLSFRLKMKALHMERSWFDLIKVETNGKTDPRHSPIQLDVEAFYDNTCHWARDQIVLPEVDAQREWNKLAIWFRGKELHGSLLSSCGKMKALTYDWRKAVTRHGFPWRRGHGRDGLVSFAPDVGSLIHGALQMADDKLSRIIEFYVVNGVDDPAEGYTRLFQHVLPDQFAAHCEQCLHGDTIKLASYRKYSKLTTVGTDVALCCRESLQFTASTTFREIADSRVERPSKKLCTENSLRDEAVIELCITYMPLQWRDFVGLWGQSVCTYLEEID